MSAFLLKVSQGKERHTFRCTNATTVAEIKQQIQQNTWIPFPAQRLTYKGKQLADDVVLAELNLKASSRLMLLFTKAYHAVSVHVAPRCACPVKGNCV